jgi:preprotein translocase subunit SecF
MPFELIRPGTHIDFLGKRRICALVSVGLLLASLGAVLVRGVKLGIDFAGGTEVQVRFDEVGVASEGSVRQIVTVCGVEEASVVRFGGEAGEFLIKFGAPSPEMLQGALGNSGCPLYDRDRVALEEASGLAEGADTTGVLVDLLSRALTNEVGPLVVQRVEFVGPRVGGELRRDGVNALLIACVLILLYVAFRFSARFAPGAIVALVHDIGITAGLFVILGLEFDLRVLAALLAILGYSLNDTIIIYDRIRENMELRTKFDLEDVLNRSVNQTLSRTVLTSGTTLAAVLALLFLGGEVLRPFALAMVVGVFVGTYSSAFIAAPTLLWLENRFGDGGGEASHAPHSGTKRPSGAAPRPSKKDKKGKKGRAKARA